MPSASISQAENASPNSSVTAARKNPDSRRVTRPSSTARTAATIGPAIQASHSGNSVRLESRPTAYPPMPAYAP